MAMMMMASAQPSQLAQRVVGLHVSAAMAAMAGGGSACAIVSPAGIACGNALTAGCNVACPALQDTTA
eukprot:400325-Karenia_brevis.AAC.1